LAAALTVAAAPAFAGDLTVTLTGVQDKGGQMLVSLQSRDQFMKPAGANGAFGQATPGTQTFTVRGVDAGEYAVMVMHDADSDWQMAYGPDRKPTEGWAMSGKADDSRKPTFDEVKITVPADGGGVTIPMVYP
jgi:uncharacterized protein (DUF2141 family)